MGTRWQGWPGGRNCKVATSTFPSGEWKEQKARAIKEQLMKSPATENWQNIENKSLQSLLEHPWHGQGDIFSASDLIFPSSEEKGSTAMAMSGRACRGGRAWDFLNREGSSTKAPPQGQGLQNEQGENPRGKNNPTEYQCWLTENDRICVMTLGVFSSELFWGVELRSPLPGTLVQAKA